MSIVAVGPALKIKRLYETKSSREVPGVAIAKLPDKPQAFIQRTPSKAVSCRIRDNDTLGPTRGLKQIASFAACADVQITADTAATAHELHASQSGDHDGLAHDLGS